MEELSNETKLTSPRDESGLKDASGYVFLAPAVDIATASPAAATSQQIFCRPGYRIINGFSPNDKEIIGKFRRPNKTHGI
jgi:hypothetical protein